MSNNRLLQILEMLKSEPNDSFLNYALALEYAKENNVKKSIEILQNVIAADGNYLAAYYQLGKYFEELYEIDNATSIYQNGIVIAKQQKNMKTLNELNEALQNLDESI